MESLQKIEVGQLGSLILAQAKEDVVVQCTYVLKYMMCTTELVLESLHNIDTS
jgi:hypothetical protein